MKNLQLQQRVEKLERAAMTPLEQEIETLMLALLKAGISYAELEQIMNEVKS